MPDIGPLKRGMAPAFLKRLGRMVAAGEVKEYMRGYPGKVACALAVVGVFGTACTPAAQRMPAEGTIARIGGEVRALKSEEVESVCQSHYCEPNYVYTTQFARPRPTPTPPRPTPTPSPTPTSGVDEIDYAKRLIRAPEAWRVSEGSAEIVVAVIDTGVELDHPELADRLARDSDGAFGYDFANNRRDARDDNGHGTHVAGTIAAELNGRSVAGVAPKVRILPVKFLRGDGSGTAEAAIASINYAVRNGAHILSNSWGGGGRSALMEEAIRNAQNQGVLVVAAAGNESSNNDQRASFPAGYPGVVSVASSDEGDRLSSFSNFGVTSVTLAAPGSNILSTYLGKTQRKLSGTSMATPQVSGALALAMSVNATLSRAALQERLCASSKRILLSQTKCGRLDVMSLLESVR